MLVAGILLFTGCRKEKIKICDLYEEEVGYTIGTIQSYTTSPFKVTYKYDYTVSGVDHDGKEKAYGIGQLDENLVGRQFIVIYELANPSNSDLNVDYLIESEQDFEDFADKYSSEPPSPDFPENCD